MAYSVGKAVREVKKKTDSSYFLSGNDYFLQNFFISNLNKINNFEYKIRYLNFEEELDIKIFLEEISSVSLFNIKEIFVLRNLVKLSKDNKDYIINYLNNPKDTLISIFVSDDFYSKNKFFHSIAIKSKTIDTRTPFPNKIKEWVKYYVNTKGILIDYSYLDDIISVNNDEIITIINEVEKLYLENGCKEVRVSESNNISTNNKNIRPWFLQDSLANKNIKQSIYNVELLQYNGYSIIPIIINLYTLYNHMLLSYDNTGSSSYQYGLNKIIVSNMNKYSSNYTKTELMNILIDLKNIDLLAKSTNLNHDNLIYIFMIKICNGYYE